MYFKAGGVNSNLLCRQAGSEDRSVWETGKESRMSLVIVEVGGLYWKGV